MDVDIISYKLDSNTNFKINRKLYKQAVERGIYFEIPYASALKSSNFRKNMISRAHLYHSIGKSANIIISSGALNEFQVRGPYDVINLYPLNTMICINRYIYNIYVHVKSPLLFHMQSVIKYQLHMYL